MDAHLQEIQSLVATGHLKDAIDQLRNILALGESEMLSDIMMLSGRYHKLRSDVRKGVIDYQSENREFNRISSSLIELLKEMDDDPAHHLQGFGTLNKELDGANRSRIDLKKQLIDLDLIESSLIEATRVKKQAKIDEAVKQALFRRMAFIKERNLSVRLLWVDDFLESIQHEIAVLKVLGISFDFARSSEDALQLAANNQYDVMISDIIRDEKQEGLSFLRKIHDAGYEVPLIFYISDLHPEKGTPPYAFGIAEYPSDLVHLVCDVLERK